MYKIKMYIGYGIGNIVGLMIMLMILYGCCPDPIIIMPDGIYENIDEMSEDFGAKQYKDAVLIHIRDIGAVKNINIVDSIYVIVKEIYDAY